MWLLIPKEICLPLLYLSLAEDCVLVRPWALNTGLLTFLAKALWGTIVSAVSTLCMCVFVHVHACMIVFVVQAKIVKHMPLRTEDYTVL